MGIKKIIRYFFIFLSLIFACEAIPADDKKTGYGLFLSPESCFLLNNESECDIIVTINWRLQKEGDYCLYNKRELNPLDCWQNKNQADKKILLKIEQDIYFQLRYQKTGSILFETPLKLYKRTKNLRPKRRNPWSFY